MINQDFEHLFQRPKREKDGKMEQFHFGVVASIQEVIEEIIQKVVTFAVKQTGIRKLVMAGGVALNCVANGKLLRKNIVDDIWVQPCSGDGGGALGAALLEAYSHYSQKRTVNPNDSQKGSYLGPRFTQTIEKVLQSFGFDYEYYDSKEKLFEETVNQIIEGNIIGFFQGRMEYEPQSVRSKKYYC